MTTAARCTESTIAGRRRVVILAPETLRFGTIGMLA